MPRTPLCMVCARRPSVGLFRDPLGWYALCCSERACCAPPGTDHYDYVMSVEDFLACRRMIQANRTKVMSGEYGSGQGVRYLGSAVEQRRRFHTSILKP